MNVYHQLKIAILTALVAPAVQAITLAPVKILSASGDLLYAEIPFDHAEPDSNLVVGLADVADLATLNLNTPNNVPLNFFTRRNAKGSGVIVMTSSQPFTANELNVVIKVQEGNGTRLQLIKQAISKPQNLEAQAAKENKLTPEFIVNEKDIALNLPESTPYSTENLRSVSPISKTDSATSNSAPALVKNTSKPINTPKAPAPKAKNPQVQAKNLNPKRSQQHVVKHKESLWGIAQKVAQQTHQPITLVMQNIKKDNQNAFIQGDMNRLRQGAILQLNVSSHTPIQIEKTSKVLPSTQPAKRIKYRLNQAEMNLVADREQDSSQGNAKHKTKSEQSNTALALKVKTAREKTFKLQQGITELELSLKQKDQKIELLNARLAQLQQKLKNQDKSKKLVH